MELLFKHMAQLPKMEGKIIKLTFCSNFGLKANFWSPIQMLDENRYF